MGKKDRQHFTPEFKKEAVRLTQTRGRTIGQIALGLGIGLSTLKRWKRRYRDAEVLVGPDDDSAKM